MIHPEHQALINLFKADDEQAKHRAIVIVQDIEAQRVLSAWPVIEKDFVWPSHLKVPDAATPDAWGLLWSATRINLATVSHYSAVSRERAEVIVGVLKGARLIYPDGSISAVAAGMLEKRMKKFFHKELKT